MARDINDSAAADRTYAEQPLVTPSDGATNEGYINGRPEVYVTESTVPENRSLGELFSELSADMSELLRQEVALAQAEMSGKVSKIAAGAGMAAGGGMLAYAGLILLLIAISFFLTQWMVFWIASGIIAIVALVIGLILLQVGRSRIQNTSVTPDKTIESLKQDVEWAKEQVQ